jgi:hypothetical protein
MLDYYRAVDLSYPVLTLLNKCFQRAILRKLTKSEAVPALHDTAMIEYDDTVKDQQATSIMHAQKQVLRDSYSMQCTCIMTRATIISGCLVKADPVIKTKWE